MPINGYESLEFKIYKFSDNEIATSIYNTIVDGYKPVTFPYREIDIPSGFGVVMDISTFSRGYSWAVLDDFVLSVELLFMDSIESTSTDLVYYTIIHQNLIPDSPTPTLTPTPIPTSQPTPTPATNPTSTPSPEPTSTPNPEITFPIGYVAVGIVVITAGAILVFFIRRK